MHTLKKLVTTPIRPRELAFNLERARKRFAMIFDENSWIYLKWNKDKIEEVEVPKSAEDQGYSHTTQVIGITMAVLGAIVVLICN